MLRHAEALLEAARRAEAEVRAEAGLHVPEVRIASFPSAAAGLVPMALRELRSAQPDVRPRLRIIEDEGARSRSCCSTASTSRCHRLRARARAVAARA